MPLIEVRALERWFESPDTTTERLIAALTDAACSVLGEDQRKNVWVVVQPVDGKRWGVAGKPAG